MILPDVNVLVYGYRNEADGHEKYADWLRRIVSGEDELALPDHCLFGFLRIVTNKRIFADPSPMSTALAFVQRLRSAHRMRQVAATNATWDAYIRFTDSDPAVKGNLVPDAYLAALAVSHGARLATTDRGFARYEGVQLVNPLADDDPPGP